MFIVTVDVEKCQACADCVDTCPNELMALIDDGGRRYAMYKGDPDDCIGCFTCESTCAEGAVTITEL